MKNLSQKPRLLALISASMMLGTTSAHATDYTHAIKVGGFVDLYYQTSINRPANQGNLAGRWYDYKLNRESLGAAQINVSHDADPKHLGFTLDLALGDNPAVLHSTEPGGVNNYKWIQQAYVTAVTNTLTPVTIDVGQYYSWIGYETLESPANENYSRSFLFTVGQPDYVIGARAGASLTKTLALTTYWVNGYNEAVDSNHGKTLGATLAYNPNPRLGLTGQWWGGQEGSQFQNQSGSYGGIGFPTVGVRTVNLADGIATYQLDARTKFALNGTYADAATGTATSRGHWSGVEVVGSRQVSKTLRSALRFEQLDDPQGLRTGLNQVLHSATVTLDVAVKQTLTFRFEVRRDFSSQPYFQTSQGQTRARTTLTFAQVFKF